MQQQAVLAQASMFTPWPKEGCHWKEHQERDKAGVVQMVQKGHVRNSVL